MAGAILALNAGSSSLKFALYRTVSGTIEPIAKGQIDRIDTAPRFAARDAGGAIMIDTPWPIAPFPELIDRLLEWIEPRLDGHGLAAAGHRVLHGGRDFIAPVRLTGAVLSALEALTPLAPLHQPHSLAPVRAIRALRPGLPQIACFDTAFHHTMPAVATRFALPRAYEDEGVRHYGFHGLSYEFIARRLRLAAPRLAAGRVVVAHLGNGASLCAMRAGVSVDTTMTFTALDGLAMGTRCGALDPGVLLYMLQQKHMKPDDIEHLLYEQSGLLGVSGLSGDMRVLLASDLPRAREAVELFVFRIARETAALAASLGGLDGFVFTGGIGENAPAIRAAVSERLRWLGVEILVVPTDEEAMIAQHTIETLS